MNCDQCVPRSGCCKYYICPLSIVHYSHTCVRTLCIDLQHLPGATVMSLESVSVTMAILEAFAVLVGYEYSYLFMVQHDVICHTH